MVTPWLRVKVPGLRESELGSHTFPPSRDEVWLTFNWLVLTPSASCYHEYYYWSVAQLLSHVWLFVITWAAAGFYLHCLPGRACSNSCPLHRWCHPTISSSVIPFSSCRQSSPASGSLPMSQFFTSGGQSIGASGLISFRIDWLDLLEVQGTLKSVLQLLSNTSA